jgi:hypothetical protein
MFHNAVLSVVVGAALIVASATNAAELVNKNKFDVAILGFDAVAYFTKGQPTKGNRKFEHVWHDATWQFSSPEHRDLFASNPKRYAPRYGGFCAGAMATGRKRPIDPSAWLIIDGKLYLNYAKRVGDEFAKNSKKKIARADANWKRLGHTK